MGQLVKDFLRPLRDLWPEPQLLYTRETASTVLATSMLSQEQEKVAESRVKNMKIFQGVNTVAIEQVSTQYPLPLGNCSEYLPWEALLNGNHKRQERGHGLYGLSMKSRSRYC
ncbi:uncharacterized protein OCT59_008275 [Rhizophagus irregularis]|uniref:uncharacterized protein n=1 Tax=Rhizophagus irregularis TaxID=588596 RepID=UPI00331FB9E6|nr:hypothetical protein OCT59_008275 [Rhizophagus irregularis]